MQENFSKSINQEPLRATKRFHIKARTEKAGGYPDRFPVPDNAVDWETDFTGYNPTYYLAQKVIDNDVTRNPKGYADPEDVERAKSLRTLRSYEGKIVYDKVGRPRNTRGRTGIEGRGVLGKWGANFAADPIITRINPETKELEMIAILRDNGEWAIPGGMVDYGEAISKTLQRELKEETGVDVDMDDAVPIYDGYVDDPRNTDNAWMETNASHKHLSQEVAEKMVLKAGDDAKAVRWEQLTPEGLIKMYASHGELIKKAVADFYSKNKDSLDNITRTQIEAII